MGKRDIERKKRRRALSERWKCLEREVAKELGGDRILRGADFSKSLPDVVVADIPALKVDCKAYKRFTHHSLMQEILDKYCSNKSDIPVLVTKHHRQRGSYATIPLSFLGILLAHYRRDATSEEAVQELSALPSEGVDGDGEDRGG